MRLCTFQVSTLIQCLCSINAVRYWARVTFRGGLHNVKKAEFTHFKMADASSWTFRLSLLLGDRFSKEENKSVREESEEFKTTRENNVV